MPKTPAASKRPAKTPKPRVPLPELSGPPESQAYTQEDLAGYERVSVRAIKYRCMQGYYPGAWYHGKRLGWRIPPAALLPQAAPEPTWTPVLTSNGPVVVPPHVHLSQESLEAYAALPRRKVGRAA